MNDINVILGKISGDAQAQYDSILAAAADNCRKIGAEHQQMAKQQHEEILKAAATAAEAVRLRAASQSGIEARNLRLEARRAAIDAAFEKAMERLCAMSDEKKVALYAYLSLHAIVGQAELTLNAAEKASIGKSVVALIGKKFVSDGIGNVVDALTSLKLPDKSITRTVVLSEETGAFRGGFKLREGNIETNCTFETMVATAKEELEPEVAQILFK